MRGVATIVVGAAVVMFAVTAAAMPAGALVGDPPPNDAYATRHAMAVNTRSWGTTDSATREGGEPSTCSGGPSVWYSVTTPGPGVLTASTWISDGWFGIDQHAASQHAIGIFTGASLDALHLERCFFSGDPGRAAEVVAGTYVIAIYGQDEPVLGPFALEVQFDSPPVNDDIANATTVPFSTTDPVAMHVVGTTRGALHTSSELRASCTWIHADTGTVWFKTTVPSDGVVTFAPPPAPAPDPGPKPQPIVSLDPGVGDSHIAFNDQRVTVSSSGDVTVNQTDGGSPSIGVFRAFGDTSNLVGWCDTSAPSFRATKDTTYYIAVATYPGRSDFSINARFLPPPANDDFANATPSALNSVITGTTEGATAEYGETSFGCYSYYRPTNSVWYRFVAPQDGSISVDDGGNGHETTVVRGSTIDSARATECDGVIEDVHAGEVFIVDVQAGDWMRPGPFKFIVNFTPAPSNDSFTGPQPLGASVLVPGDNTGATRDPGQPNPESTTYAASLWYRYTPTVDGVAVVSLDGPNQRFAVVTGTSAADTRSIPLEGGGVSIDGPEEAYVVSKGVNYYIVVYSPGCCSRGAFTLRVAQSAPATDGSPNASVTSASVTEGAAGAQSKAHLAVHLDQPSSLPLIVNYATSDSGLAKAGHDYAPTSGSLQFNPGETDKTVDVTIYGDNIDEYDEAFALDLTAGSPNVGISRGHALVTIVDDDAAPVVTLADSRVLEGNSGSTLLPFDVSMSGATEKVVTLAVRTTDGTALSTATRTTPADYAATSGQVTFSGGASTATIYVPVAGDRRVEPDETLGLNVLSLVNATSARAAATGTILNDDGRSPR